MMKRRMAAGAAALALLTGGGLLAGCGSSSDSSSGGAASTAAADTTAQSNGIDQLSADKILEKSMAAAKSATSVTVKGAVNTDGQNIKIDMQAGNDKATGSISAQGVDMQIRFVDGKTYFKLSGDAFAKLAGAGSDAETAKAISALIGDKWLVVPNDNSAGQLGQLSAFGQKDSLLEGVLNPSSTLSVAGTGTANGQSVVLLEGQKKDGTLAVATTGTPYPVQIKGGDSSGSGQIDFSNWSAPVEVTAPTDVIDLSALAKLDGSSGSGSSSG